MIVKDAEPTGPECTVPGDGAAVANLELSAVQLQHASTINAVGIARGLPERARVIALATAWQESTMRNIDFGDRDSLGLFQQRPSQGWGEPEQIMDPVYSSGRFYDALVDVQGWEDLPLTEAAQEVQYSGFPDAYAKWEDEAQTLARALGGGSEPDLGCRAGSAAPTSAAPTRKKVPGTDDASPALGAVLAAANAELGGLQVISVSDDGRTATVLAKLANYDAPRAARILAAWTVSRTIGGNVQQVGVQGRTWAEHAWAASDPAGDPAEVRITVGG